MHCLCAMPAPVQTGENACPEPPAHLFGQLAAVARARPHASVLVNHDGMPMSYRELHDAAQYLAGYLQHHLEVRAGDRVALLMGAGRELAIACYAVLRCDAAVVTIRPGTPATETAGHLQASHAQVIITAQAMHDALAPLLAAGRLRGTVVAAAGNGSDAPVQRHTHTLSGALAAGIAPLRMGPGGDGLAVVDCASGAGSPASAPTAMLSHRALAAMAASECRSPCNAGLDDLLALQRAVSHGGCLIVRVAPEPAFSTHF